jgi:hypothetical protein
MTNRHPAGAYVYNNNVPQTWAYAFDNGADAGYIVSDSLSVSCAGVSAQFSATPSVNYPGQISTFDVKFTASPSAVPGACDLTLTWTGPPGTVSRTLAAAVNVYDATPQITEVDTTAPTYPGGAFYITLYGYNFGPAQGSLSICTSATDPCNGTPDLTVSLNAPPWSVWRDNQINALLTPSSNALGTYYVQVTSYGENGNSFAAAPQQATQSTSNRKQFQVACAAPQVSITSKPGPNWLNINNQAYLVAGVNAPGTSIWTSDNPALISFPDGPTVTTSSIGATPSVRMQVNGSGKATITVTHTIACGSSATDSFIYVVSTM